MTGADVVAFTVAAQPLLDRGAELDLQLRVTYRGETCGYTDVRAAYAWLGEQIAYIKQAEAQDDD